MGRLRFCRRRRGCAIRVFAAADELEIFDDNGELAVLAALFVFPGVIAEAAFDEEWPAFVAIVNDGVGQLAEGGAIDEGGVDSVLALRCAEFPVDGQAEFSDLSLSWQLFENRIAGEIPQQQDAIETRHETSEVSAAHLLENREGYESPYAA